MNARHLVVIAAAVLIRPLGAQSTNDSLPPIDTDRPDVTDGVHTVPRGMMQVESGYTFRHMGSGVGDEHSFPELLVRAAISGSVEARVGVNYLAAPGARGFDDAEIGTKIALSQARTLWPAISMEAQASLPTGAAVWSARRVLPGAALLLGWEGASRWSAGVEELIAQSGASTAEATTSLSVQYQGTPRAQWFGEVFSIDPIHDPATRAERYTGAGVLILLGTNAQLDARIGAGLDRHAARVYTGAGFSIRR